MVRISGTDDDAPPPVQGPEAGGFWDLVESGPILSDARGRQHVEPAKLGLREKTAVGIFFSGHWCPPSRSFTPDLIDSYNRWAKSRNFEIIFCSSDQDEGEFWDYFGEMPWKAIPFGDRRVDTLSEWFSVRGIPTLIIVGPDGRVITEDGRSRVDADPFGRDFPWYPSHHRREQCERALRAHKLTLGTPLNSATVGGKGGGSSRSVIQVRDGRKYTVGEVATFNNSNHAAAAITGRVLAIQSLSKPSSPFAASITVDTNTTEHATPPEAEQMPGAARSVSKVGGSPVAAALTDDGTALPLAVGAEPGPPLPEPAANFPSGAPWHATVTRVWSGN